MFRGRKKELATLEEIYSREGFAGVIVSGRRRVGKTTLLSEFCKGKNNIFYVAQESVRETIILEFGKKVTDFFFANDYIVVNSWDKIFELISTYNQPEKLVVVVDEYPYMVNADRSVQSILQRAIDHQLKNANIMLVLCGSSVSFMENEIIAYKNPLYGRFDWHLRVKPFDYFQSAEFTPKYSHEEKFTTYGILGGVPRYLESFDDTKSIKDNLCATILKNGDYLYEEPFNLLKQELREPALYNSIIEAVAKGASKLNEISTKINAESGKSAKYLKTLIDLLILKKEVPINEKENARRTIYRVNDNLFKFWFRFIFGNNELVETDNGELLYERVILPNLNGYLGLVFEDACHDYMWRLQRGSEFPIIFNKIGRWWGTDNKKKIQVEIDLLAIDTFNNNAIFCECKWQNELVKLSVLEALIEKSAMFNFNERYFALFAKCGFTKALRDYAETNKNVRLFTLDDLYK
ncbi:MAG: ATP-binding protein [Bacillota bacterium]